MHKILSVVPLSGYKLLVTFENNEKRMYDMSNGLTGVFEYLKDPGNFNTVKVVYGAPTWFPPKGLEIDLCPDALYMESIPYNEAVTT